MVNFETIVNQIRIQWQRIGPLKRVVHQSDLLFVLLEKFGVQRVHHRLQLTVCDKSRQRLPTQMNFALGALRRSGSLQEVPIYARFAKGTQTFVECVSVAKKAITKGADQEFVQVFLLNTIYVLRKLRRLFILLLLHLFFLLIVFIFLLCFDLLNYLLQLL